MTPTSSRRGRLATAGLALLTATLVPGLAQLPAVAGPSTPTAPVHPGASLLDPTVGLPDLDARGTASATATQRSAVRGLGAVDARFNRFGTPSSILPADGSLGAAPGSPATAARSWLERHAAAFGLTSSAMAGLQVVNVQQLAHSGARAVLLRQRFGDLTPALDGMVTVGIANGQVAYVSSSLVRTTATPPAATLAPAQAFARAASNVGETADAGAITTAAAGSRSTGGWTTLTVPGFSQPQQIRLRALPLADGRVRPVFETNVVDVAGGSTAAYTLMVDAVSGKILHRQDQVEASTDAFPFSGSVSATGCGPKHAFALADDKTRTITATAAMANSLNDIVVKILDPAGRTLTSSDTATSPEVATYTAAAIPAGTYTMQVCPFDSPTVPFTPPGDYAASVTTGDTAASTGGTSTPDPRWRHFPANPTLDFGTKIPTNSVIGCWLPGNGCTSPTGPFRNVQAFGPWDTNIDGVPTLTTVGNNADTHEAWASPDSPGGTAQAPVSPTREYTTPFTDAWNNSRCDPTQLRPGGNDILASVTNLFVAHNRMHDYSYYLGFTEDNYNLQAENGGRGGPDGLAGDQEVGNAQAGALSGGAPSYLGRDNANQVTLQDGTPGITNQYLFQPIAGAFYAPCTDGGLDMGIVGHEYTHAISNRMIAGPDEGITSEQGGAMGESWGDLVAGEYMFSHGYPNGGNPWAVGVYATGNKAVAIRDYAINANPLNYSDYGFDSTGNEVHADGEIWNGTQWSVRQALVNKYDARFPYADKQLQLRCAEGLDKEVRSPQAAALCPGNRRWVQLVFDAFLLQQGATSMLDARDAMLAADRMRFGGQDEKVMWRAFASRGMGRGASTPNADSGATRASFASPKERNGTVAFAAPGNGKVYVGHYEARATPVADTDPGTATSSRLTLVPGRYEMLYVSKSRGFSRFTIRVRAGESRTVTVPAPENLAARSNGASVLGQSAGSRNPDALIDGTEETSWGGVTDANVDRSKPFVTVDLAGGVRTVRRVQVSAMLRPSDTDPNALPALQVTDPDAGSRFTALRRFALEACVRSCSSPTATWSRFYTSRADAFPGVNPRPVAPNLTLRGFDVPDTRAAAVRLVTLENQCTGYAGYAGEQDADPANATDCATASDRGTIVHAAELQVY
jgi:hypothetical protein